MTCGFAIIPHQRNGLVRALSARFLLASFVIAMVVAVFAVAWTPCSAYAKSYTCPSVEIDATAAADGTLSVAERARSNSSMNVLGGVVKFRLDAFERVQARLLGVYDRRRRRDGRAARRWNSSARGANRAAPPSLRSRSTRTARRSTRSCPWRMRGSTRLAYSNIPTSCRSMTTWPSCTGSTSANGWSVDSDHVVASAHVSAPEGVDARTDNALRAWCHGPLDGTLSFGGTDLISMTVPSVKAVMPRCAGCFPAMDDHVSPSSPAVHTGERLILGFRTNTAWRTGPMPSASARWLDRWGA